MAETWNIESQRITKVLTPTGTFKDVWEIRFSTLSGVHGMIDVDVRNYNPDYVREAIDDYTARIEAVNNL